MAEVQFGFTGPAKSSTSIIGELTSKVEAQNILNEDTNNYFGDILTSAVGTATAYKKAENMRDERKRIALEKEEADKKAVDASLAKKQKEVDGFSEKEAEEYYNQFALKNAGLKGNELSSTWDVEVAKVIAGKKSEAFKDKFISLAQKNRLTGREQAVVNREKIESKRVADEKAAIIASGASYGKNLKQEALGSVPKHEWLDFFNRNINVQAAEGKSPEFMKSMSDGITDDMYDKGIKYQKEYNDNLKVRNFSNVYNAVEGVLGLKDAKGNLVEEVLTLPEAVKRYADANGLNPAQVADEYTRGELSRQMNELVEDAGMTYEEFQAMQVRHKKELIPLQNNRFLLKEDKKYSADIKAKKTEHKNLIDMINARFVDEAKQNITVATELMKRSPVETPQAKPSEVYKSLNIAYEGDELLRKRIQYDKLKDNRDKEDLLLSGPITNKLDLQALGQTDFGLERAKTKVLLGLDKELALGTRESVGKISDILKVNSELTEGFGDKLYSKFYNLEEEKDMKAWVEYTNSIAIVDYSAFKGSFKNKKDFDNIMYAYQMKDSDSITNIMANLRSAENVKDLGGGTQYRKEDYPTEYIDEMALTLSAEKGAMFRKMVQARVNQTPNHNDYEKIAESVYEGSFASTFVEFSHGLKIGGTTERIVNSPAGVVYPTTEVGKKAFTWAREEQFHRKGFENPDDYTLEGLDFPIDGVNYASIVDKDTGMPTGEVVDLDAMVKWAEKQETKVVDKKLEDKEEEDIKDLDNKKRGGRISMYSGRDIGDTNIGVDEAASVMSLLVKGFKNSTYLVSEERARYKRNMKVLHSKGKWVGKTEQLDWAMAHRDREIIKDTPLVMEMMFKGALEYNDKRAKDLYDTNVDITGMTIPYEDWLKYHKERSKIKK